VKRLITIWPANREGIPATLADAWHQDRYWVVLDITEGDTFVVEGPVTHEAALLRALELRTSAMTPKTARKESA
jgi:hypothetical protein